MNFAKRQIDRIPRAYLFPLVLSILLVVLSAFQISGTSMGVYDYMFGEPKDELIAGQPRTVRSDEWAVNTPFVMAQARDGFPSTNTDVGVGQDMGVVIDVPYREWSVVFKPQNLVFFVLPLEVAFAFKWWSLAFILMIAVYSLVLLLYPRRYILASLAGLFFFFSPFIHWWYQSITILPIAYSLLSVVLAVHLLRAKTVGTRMLITSTLAYTLTCFTLIMYPAFQITTALVALAIFAAYLYGHRMFGLFKKTENIISMSVVVIFVIAITGGFLYQHLDAVKTTLDTVYPGSRSISSGGFNPLKLATWPLSYLLLDSQTAGVFQNNQSEISNFMLFGFALLPVLLFRQLIQKRSILSRLELALVVACVTVALLFAIRMFVPIADSVFALLGLSKAPHVRLFIGLGMINLILIVISVARADKKLTRETGMAAVQEHAVIMSAFTVFYALGVAFLVRHYAIASTGFMEVAAVVLVIAAITALLCSSYTRLAYAGLALACLFGAASSGLANPLYRGLGLEHNEFATYVQSEEKLNDKYWIINDSPYLSSILLSSGAEHYGGVNTYPQLSLWKKYFSGNETIYNRYSHVRFKIDPSLGNRKIELIQGDSFRVTLSDCDPMLAELNIKYIVSDSSFGQSLPCHPVLKQELFDKKPLYIYSTAD